MILRPARPARAESKLRVLFVQILMTSTYPVVLFPHKRDNMSMSMYSGFLSAVLGTHWGFAAAKHHKSETIDNVKQSYNHRIVDHMDNSE